MQRVTVSVKFSGDVTVEVPDHLFSEDAKLLAGKLALSRIIATDENPDAPDENALENYKEHCSWGAQDTAPVDWDACKIVGLGGRWETV